jgi:hypothetical protein
VTKYSNEDEDNFSLYLINQFGVSYTLCDLLLFIAVKQFYQFQTYFAFENFSIIYTQKSNATKLGLYCFQRILYALHFSQLNPLISNQSCVASSCSLCVHRVSSWKEYYKEYKAGEILGNENNAISTLARAAVC